YSSAKVSVVAGVSLRPWMSSRQVCVAVSSHR
ncbi:MAG: hypothetical protein ACJAUC_001165, partial [Planctomycetota bacterium]